MKHRNPFGIIIKYIPFIGLLAVYIMSLCRGVTIADEIERNIQTWTNVLVMCAIIGEVGSLLVTDKFSILLIGKSLNFVDDIREESSQDVAVLFNGIFANAVIMTALIVLYILYERTQNRLFLSIATIIAIIFSIGVAVYVLASYLKIKTEDPSFIFAKLSNPVFLPVLICMIQLLVTRKNLVGFIYRNIYEPKSNIHLVIALTIVLCYFLAAIFCHYSNLYCLLGFVFINKDPNMIQSQLDCLQTKEVQLENTLRQVTKYVDEKAEQVGLIKKCGLGIYLSFIHFKTYIQNRFYAAAYVLLFIRFKITKVLMQ